MQKKFLFEKYPRENFRRGKVTKILASDEYFSPTKIFPGEIFPRRIIFSDEKPYFEITLFEEKTSWQWYFSMESHKNGL